MSRYRKVDPKMWADAKFRALSAPAPCGQSLWQYLLTGPETTSLPGLLVGGQAHFAEALGWPVEGFAKAFQEVFAQGLAKADWKARLVWLPNACRYNVPENPNVVKSWRDHWDNVPECQLKTEAWHALKAFTEGLGEAFAKAFAKACPKPLANQEQEQEPDQEQNQREPRSASPLPVVGSEAEKAPEKAPRSRRRSASTPMPDGWGPTARNFEQGKALGLDRATVELEANRFRAKAGAKDYRYADWERAFHSWLLSPFQTGNVTALSNRSRNGLLMQRDSQNASYFEAAKAESELLLGGAK